MRSEVANVAYIFNEQANQIKNIKKYIKKLEKRIEKLENIQMSPGLKRAELAHTLIGPGDDDYGRKKLMPLIFTKKEQAEIAKEIKKINKKKK